MMLADRPPLLETPLHFFLQDLTPNEAYLFAGTTLGYRRASPANIQNAGDWCSRSTSSAFFDDLRTKFEPVTSTAFSQCSGNSRTSFVPSTGCAVDQRRDGKHTLRGRPIERRAEVRRGEGGGRGSEFSWCR